MVWGSRGHGTCLTYFLHGFHSSTYLFLFIRLDERVHHAEQREYQVSIHSRHELVEIFTHESNAVFQEEIEQLLQQRSMVVVVDVRRLYVKPALNERRQFDIQRVRKHWLTVVKAEYFANFITCCSLVRYTPYDRVSRILCFPETTTL